MDDLLPPQLPRPSYDLKMDSQGGIYDIATDNWEPPDNVQAADRSIKDDGIDEIVLPPEPVGGGGALGPIEVRYVRDNNTPGLLLVNAEDITP